MTTPRDQRAGLHPMPAGHEKFPQRPYRYGARRHPWAERNMWLVMSAILAADREFEEADSAANAARAARQRKARRECA